MTSPFRHPFVPKSTHAAVIVVVFTVLALFPQGTLGEHGWLYLLALLIGAVFLLLLPERQDAPPTIEPEPAPEPEAIFNKNLFESMRTAVAQRREAAAKQERVLCPAVWIRDGKLPHPGAPVPHGIVFSGQNHPYAAATAFSWWSMLSPAEKVAILATHGADGLLGRSHQGFLTTSNRFVSRSEAMEIAKAAQQVPCTLDRTDLFDTDLESPRKW